MKLMGSKQIKGMQAPKLSVKKAENKGDESKSSEEETKEEIPEKKEYKKEKPVNFTEKLLKE